MIRPVLATILIAAALGLSETEKCFLRALRGDSGDYQFDGDEQLLKAAVRDSNLLPPALKDELAKCMGATFDDGCEARFGKNQCEFVGLVRVRKCDHGFKRVDTGLCAQLCPEGTFEEAGGALCVKPPVVKRSVYRDLNLCVHSHTTCDKVDGVFSSACPPNYRQLSRLLCAFQCPPDFADTPRHCVPPRLETPEHFLPRFEPALGGISGVEN